MYFFLTGIATRCVPSAEQPGPRPQHAAEHCESGEGEGDSEYRTSSGNDLKSGYRIPAKSGYRNPAKSGYRNLAKTGYRNLAKSGVP